MYLLFKLKEQASYIISCFILQFILVLPAFAQDIKYLDFLNSINKDLLHQKAVDIRNLHGSEKDSIKHFLKFLSHNCKLNPDLKRKKIQANEIAGEILEIIKDKEDSYTFGKLSTLMYENNAHLNLKLKNLIYFASTGEGVFFIDLQQNDPSLMVVSDWNALNFQMMESKEADNVEIFSQDFIIEDYNVAICERVLREEKMAQRPQPENLLPQGQVLHLLQPGVSALSSNSGQALQLLAQLLTRAQQAALEQDQAPDENSFLRKYRCFQQVEAVKQLNESQLELEEFAEKYNFVPSELRGWKSRVESYHKEIKPAVRHTPQEKEKILEEYDQKSKEADFDFDKFYEDNGFKKEFFITLIRKTRGQNEVARAMKLSSDSVWKWSQRRDFAKEYKEGGADSLERRTQFCLANNIDSRRFPHWLNEFFDKEKGENSTKRYRDEDEKLDIKMAYEDAKKHGMPRDTFFNLIKVTYKSFSCWEERKNLKRKQ